MKSVGSFNLDWYLRQFFLQVRLTVELTSICDDFVTPVGLSISDSTWTADGAMTMPCNLQLLDYCVTE